MIVVVLVLLVILVALLSLYVVRELKTVTHAPPAIDPRALEHAERAHTALDWVERRLKTVANYDEMQRLDLIAGGGAKQHNSEVDTTLELARTHALTALAFGGYPMGALERSGDPLADKDGVRELVEAGAHG